MTLLNALSDFHFFKVVTAVWLLPPDTEVICYPTAKSAWSQWVKNEFCDLTFTFCPSVAGLHHHKETFMGPPFPSPGSYMANPQQSYLSVREHYMAHLPSETLSSSSTVIWSSNRYAARLGYQLNCLCSLDLFVSKCMFNHNWILLKLRFHNNNKEDYWELLNP